uniref:Uncharacterized protein n=1 Tax=Fagus sylvatica TaxID=28930 RepID=A0A2N9IBJ7_FAGSY
MKLNQSMPDEEARSKMSQFATDFAKNATVHACHEGLKIIPGGTSVYKIVSRSLHDGKKVESNEGEIKALQAKIGKMEEDIMECKKVIERAEIIHKPFADFKSQDTSYFESNGYYQKM